MVLALVDEHCGDSSVSQAPFTHCQARHCYVPTQHHVDHNSILCWANTIYEYEFNQQAKRVFLPTANI